MQRRFRIAAAGAFLAGAAAAGCAAGAPRDLAPLEPALPEESAPADAFWAPRLETNRAVTIPHLLGKLEAQGSLGGFRILAELSKEPYRGYMWGDSDVYKTIEGMARTLGMRPDAPMEARMESIVASIVRAQAPDGYLFPHLQLAEPSYRAFSDEGSRTCESYSIGHLIESAVEHRLRTGRTVFLDTARRAADLLARVHAEGRLPVSGHPEIELALVKLYRATGAGAYLDLAASLIDGARRTVTLWSNGRPPLGHDEAWGHVVAMLYLYCAAVDVAVLTNDRPLFDRMIRKWEDAAGRKLYITGGLGHSGYGEGFGPGWDLPNARAYCETCAAIANALWNHRLFLATGDAAFLDVLERSLYNNIASGVGLSGDRFFYVNPLATDGRRRFNQGSAERFAWTGCPCCPVNIVRFLPQVPALACATRDGDVYVNLFLAGATRVRRAGGAVVVRQKTSYPWDGRVELAIEPEEAARFALHIRIPGWARGRPVPTDLYRYAGGTEERAAITLAVNSAPADLAIERGFARLERTWERGDTVVLGLPMAVRRVLAHENVEDDAGRTALERGPIVYCAEGIDNENRIANLILPDDAPVAAEPRPGLLGGVTVLRAEGRSLRRTPAGEVEAAPAPITLVPYCVWNHRGPGPMAVWLARTPAGAVPAPAPTPASRSRVTVSYCNPSDTPDALNDQIVGESSHDLTPPRLTWWDHKGTREWAQYDFEAPVTVRGSAVYWFDDTGTGGCKAPRRWSLLRLDGRDWRPVEGASEYGTRTDVFNEVTFTPVRTAALRLEVELRPGASGGIIEWRVLE